MDLIGTYQNGNYTVQIYDDGTKIRSNDLDFFDPEFPESMDIKITNACDMGCPMCHENSTPDGKHGDILHLPFLETIHPYTELAIGGGNPLSHPDFVEFLRILQRRNIIANVTVSQRHFLENKYELMELSAGNLIRGLGVSISPGIAKKDVKPLMYYLSFFPNAVIHVINGIHTVEELHTIAFQNLKVLILGYKEFRRGKTLYAANGARIEKNKAELYGVLPTVINDGWFQAVSFDNLAIRQLDVRRLLSDQEWDAFYMGDDGRDGAFTSASMYIDAVEMEFSRNSCSTRRYPVTNDLTEMYQFLKTEGADA